VNRETLLKLANWYQRDAESMGRNGFTQEAVRYAERAEYYRKQAESLQAR